MASNIINRFNHALRKFDQMIDIIIFGRGFPPGAACALQLNSDGNWSQPSHKSNPFSLKNIMGDGFLWGVPTCRRTIEKRLCRKFGIPDYVWKPLVAKTNLLMCNACGHYHEVGVLCPNCYQKIMKETKEMQTAITDQLGLNPVEKDVIVIYKGEKEEWPSDQWKSENQYVIEMSKKRPNWFSQNLLQRTTQQPSDSSNVESIKLV